MAKNSKRHNCSSNFEMNSFSYYKTIVGATRGKAIGILAGSYMVISVITR
jgi:hypothetical protein